MPGSAPHLAGAGPVRTLPSAQQSDISNSLKRRPSFYPASSFLQVVIAVSPVAGVHIAWTPTCMPASDYG
jgi:hypothetical protein